MPMHNSLHQHEIQRAFRYHRQLTRVWQACTSQPSPRIQHLLQPTNNNKQYTTLIVLYARSRLYPVPDHMKEYLW